MLIFFPHRELKRARHIGSYESEEDAARAYDREAIKMLGPDAGLNFRESERPASAPCLLNSLLLLIGGIISGLMMPVSHFWPDDARVPLLPD